MLEKMIPDFDAEIEELSAIAPAGYVMAFNCTVYGPEYVRSGYPAAWQAEYEENDYHMGDPILMWALTCSGVKRWSDINVPDIRGVMRRASSAGLRYGAALSVKNGRKRSILTVARADREIEDQELDRLAAKFELWCDLATNRVALTERELDVLRMLRNGHSQRHIAGALGIAEATVKQRAVRATGKLGATNRIQAVAIALQRGFLD